VVWTEFPESAVALVFSDRWNLRLDKPWIAVGAFGPAFYMRDFAMGHIVWSVTAALLIFVSRRSIAFLRVIRLTDFVTQLNVVFHAEFLFSWHIFYSFCLCFNKWYRQGSSLFMSVSVTLIVDNLYAEAIEAVKSRPTLSASTPI
jgi:hypothetical protein